MTRNAQALLVAGLRRRSPAAAVANSIGLYPLGQGLTIHADGILGFHRDGRIGPQTSKGPGKPVVFRGL